MVQSPALIGVTAAAQLLGVSAGTVRNLEARGQLRAFRDSASRRLFLPLDVAQLKAELDAEREAQARKRTDAPAPL